jgi:tryptophan 2,3-dioxygenase
VLTAALDRRSLYDEFLHLLARRGHPVPADVLERDLREPHREDSRLVEVFRAIYDEPERSWDVYETCEELVDIEDNLQLWRFRHLKTVERTIGFRTGTGGTTGASFLRRVLDLTFFPELYAVRTAL